ncbi:hypothetical protein BDV12DRAFT_186813 [Aspergillus spectabilis]
MFTYVMFFAGRLVSQNLCKTIQPILYHDFMLGYGDSWRSDLYTWNGQLTSFMRTVARRRDLAAPVRRIYIHPYRLEYFHGEKVVRFYDVSWYTDTETIIHPQPRQYILEDEAQDLPNLQHCSLQLGPHPNEIVRSAGLSAAGVSHLPVKTLGISLRSTAQPLLLGVCTGLETLNLHMCGGLPRRGQYKFPSLPNLKSLCLTFSRLDEWSLKALLSFYYECTKPISSGSAPSHESGGHFQLPNAIPYLTRHGTTLESLFIDFRSRGCVEGYRGPKPVFTFQNFKSLRHLFFNMDDFHTRFWAGYPASAEDQDFLIQLLPSARLAEVTSRGRFPTLEGIQLDDTKKLDNEDQIQVLFEAAGVSFAYRGWELSRSTMGNHQGKPLPNFWDSPFDLPYVEDPNL